MKKVIIDCDPGHDDAIAICLALANSDLLQIKAITTVGGNQTLEKVTRNALTVVELLEADIEVYAGASGPLVRGLETGADAHGSTGMDGPDLPEPKKQASNVFAVEQMAKILRDSDEKMTLIALGPLTNIALLLKAFPDVIDKISEITLMGGGLFIGNMTSAAEFNIYVDPESARIVYEAGIPIIMSGLDVTNKAYILNEEYQALKEKGKVSRFVADLLDFYYKYGALHGYVGSAMHDACAVAYLIAPELFESRMYHVEVLASNDGARGMTLADTRPIPLKAPNAKVLMDVDREGFVKLLFDAFQKLDESLS